MDLKKIINAVLGTIAETPAGAPGGILYAGLSSQGISFEKFQQIQSFVVGAGLVDLRGDLWFPTQKLIGAFAAAKAFEQRRRWSTAN